MEKVSPPGNQLLATANRVRFSQASPRPAQSGDSLAAGNTESGAVPELSYEFGSSEIRITVSGQARQALLEHCGESNSHGREVGGILVGYRYERTQAGDVVRHYATLTDLIPVQSGDSSEAHVRFDEDSWELVERQMAERFFT